MNEGAVRAELVEATVNLMLRETDLVALEAATDDDLLSERDVKPGDIPLIRLRIRLAREMIEHVRRFPLTPGGP